MDFDKMKYCKECKHKYMKQWNKNRINEVCGICGELDRYDSGDCRVCKKRNAQSHINDICDICGELDRNTSGGCRICKKKNAQNRINEVCGICGELDRMPSGGCRVCHKRTGEQWTKDNPDKKKAHRQNRRARLSENGGSFTAKQWRDLFNFFANRCIHPECLEDNLTYTPNDIHADHAISIKNGGTSNIDNMQPLCEHHNFRKHTDNTDYRLDAIEYLGLDIEEYYKIINA